ncbi:MAG: DNA internalization-related competence protein ComEC/Rec2 [Lachnospiraceae bacterium]|nr:DNA internalization-related competence protein ComEC/Rec2 [Lachnospiraceae bacterium]
MKYSAEHAVYVFCRICGQLGVTGISGDRLSVFYRFGLYLWFLAAGLACSWLTWRFFTGRRRRIVYGIVAGICFLAGVVVCAGYMPVFYEADGTERTFEELDGECVQGSGIIEQVFEKDGTVTLLVGKVRLFSPFQGNPGRNLYIVYEENSAGDDTSETDLYRPGQSIRFSGTFSQYSSASNPGVFDYREYCWSLGIAGQVETTKEHMQTAGKGFFIRYQLMKLRNFIRNRILLLAQPEDAGILVCILTGDKSQLNSYWKELYQEGGIIHLLTISGLHISILGMGVFRILRKLMGSFFWSSLISGIFTGAFCMMAGSGTSMVRAMICFFLYLLAGYVGKTYDFLTAVAVSGILILLEHPLLLFQSGFLMTFCCVLGIGFLLPMGELIFIAREERKVSGKKRKLIMAFQKILLSAVLLQVSSLPVVLWYQGKVPLAGALINMITVPFMSFVLISDILAAAGSLFFMPAGIFLLGAAHYILRWYEQVCLFFGKLTFASAITGRPRWWQIFLWFTVLMLVLAAGYVRVICHPGMRRLLPSRVYRKISENRNMPFIMGLLLLPCAVVILQRYPDSRLMISFLDVGQGDGIVVELPYGEGVFCIDGGSSSQKKLSEYVYEPYFAYEGIDSVDCWLLTHPDSDHYSGMLAMLEEGFSVKKIMMPEVFRDSELAQRIELLHPVSYIRAGDRIQAGDVRLEILHPAADYNSFDENDASAVVYLQWGDFTALFTGDMSLESEDEVMEALEGRSVDLLKVAHHGSKTATSEEFLRSLEVKTAVLSCGKNNRYGHPHREVMERLEDAGIVSLKTSEAGCIQVFSDGRGYEAEYFQKTGCENSLFRL